MSLLLLFPSAPSSGSAGYRSMLAFWMGGVSAGAGTPVVIPIMDQGAGAGRKQYGLTQKDISDLRAEYKRIFETAIPTEIKNEIIATVTPYAKENKKSKASEGLFYLQPKANQVDFAKLLENSASLERLEIALEQFRQWEEEEFCLLIMLAD